MPYDLLIENDDIVRRNGVTKLVNCTDEVRQSLANRLKTRKGEHFLNIGYGLDWELIFGDKGVTKDMVTIAVKECLFQDSNVQSVDSIEISDISSERTIEIIFTATLVSGEQIIEGVELIG